MNIVTPQSVARSVKTLSLFVTRHKQDEAVDFDQIDANYIIDLNGYIHQRRKHSAHCSIAILSGDHRFLFEKTERMGTHLVHEQQRGALNMIMRHLAKLNRRANITSQDSYLYDMAVGFFQGHVG